MLVGPRNLLEQITQQMTLSDEGPDEERARLRGQFDI
jgi:hypothetical protein